MCHAGLSPTNFHALLLQLDLDLVDQAQRQGCPHCGGVLHRADYPRKPWRVSGRFGWCYERRFSLCCERDGCRRRTTPGTVRFLGRRRYVAAMVVLVSALSHGVTGRRGERLRQALKVSRRTLTRWRTWWRDTFVASAFWRSVRGRLASVLDLRALPAALLEAFDGRTCRQRLLQLLRFLAPLSSTAPAAQETPSGSDYLRVGGDPQDRSVLLGQSAS